jgi:hypothetical protein
LDGGIDLTKRGNMFKNPLAPKKVDEIQNQEKGPHIPKDSVIKAVHVPKNHSNFSTAITKAKDLIKSGKSKVDVVREIYPLIQDEEKEVVHLAFMEGVGLTEKGAMTYRYNIIRKEKKK